MIRILLSLVVVLVSACSEQVSYADAERGVYQIPAMEWRIVSERELLSMYAKAGVQVPEGGRLKGFAGRCDGVPCIVTTRPRYVDDDVTTTVGHEFMHIALGDFHK